MALSVLGQIVEVEREKFVYRGTIMKKTNEILIGLPLLKLGHCAAELAGIVKCLPVINFVAVKSGQRLYILLVKELGNAFYEEGFVIFGRKTMAPKRDPARIVHIENTSGDLGAGSIPTCRRYPVNQVLRLTCRMLWEQQDDAENQR
ncbi:hypothetical protein ACFLQW_02335 [Candidatus Zixiibacteriota bacterium]